MSFARCAAWASRDAAQGQTIGGGARCVRRATFRRKRAHSSTALSASKSQALRLQIVRRMSWRKAGSVAIRAARAP